MMHCLPTTSAKHTAITSAVARYMPLMSDQSTFFVPLTELRAVRMDFMTADPPNH